MTSRGTPIHTWPSPLITAGILKRQDDSLTRSFSRLQLARMPCFYFTVSSEVTSTAVPAPIGIDFDLDLDLDVWDWIENYLVPLS